MSPKFEVPAQSPDLGEYLRILRRRAWIIAVVAVLGGAVAYAWVTNRDKTYTASGQIVVAQTTEEGFVATQNQVVQSDVVHREAQRLVPDAPRVAATFDGESGSISLRAEGTDPVLAADSIDAHIEAYKNYLTYIANLRLGAVNSDIAALTEQINALAPQTRGPSASPSAVNQTASLAAQRQALRSQVHGLQVDAALAATNVEVLRTGVPPSSASSMTGWQAVLIGLGVGLLLGVLAALLLELLDDSIRTRQDLLRIAGPDVPLLGAIPPARSRAGAVVVLEQPASPAAEAYRSLRTAVQHAGAGRTRCIAVTSARTRTGKTETAANLAVLTAQMPQRTVLVDCDMRFPRVHDFFRIPNDTGFTSVVSGARGLDSLKRIPGNDRLFVLPTGPVPPNPAELLGSSRSRELLASLDADDALVVVDTPPLLLATDALALTPALGGILLVVTVRATRKRELRKALELLRQVDAPLLGVVLHRANSAETAGFGEERSWRERRQSSRQRRLNGAKVTEPVRALASAAPSNGSAAAEPVRAIAWSAPSNGAHPDAD